MKIDRALMAGSTTLLIMSLLKDGDKYGYQMVSELSKRSDGTFDLKEGTLYPLLHTMENDGLVASYMREAENGRKRKYYRLTVKGAALYDVKTAEWKLFSEKVNEVLASSADAILA